MELGNEQSFKAEEEINKKRAQEPSQAISEETASRSKRGTTKGKKRSRETEDEENENKLVSEAAEAQEASKGIFENALSHSSRGISYGKGRNLSYLSDHGFNEHFRLEDPTELPHDEESVGPEVKQRRRKILPTIFACFGGFGREKEEKKSGTEKGEPGLRE